MLVDQGLFLVMLVVVVVLGLSVITGRLRAWVWAGPVVCRFRPGWLVRFPCCRAW
jgi:hypothetical protein